MVPVHVILIFGHTADQKKVCVEHQIGSLIAQYILSPQQSACENSDMSHERKPLPVSFPGDLPWRRKVLQLSKTRVSFSSTAWSVHHGVRSNGESNESEQQDDHDHCQYARCSHLNSRSVGRSVFVRFSRVALSIYTFLLLDHAMKVFIMRSTASHFSPSIIADLCFVPIRRLSEITLLASIGVLHLMRADLRLCVARVGSSQIRLHKWVDMLLVMSMYA